MSRRWTALAAGAVVAALVTALPGPAHAAAPSGALDPTFAAAPTDFAAAFDFGDAVVPVTGGSAVVAGRAGSADFGPGDFGLVKYSPDGTLDPTFGTGGRVVTDLSGSEDQATAAIAQPGGKIVVAGTTVDATGDANFGVARYTADGALDTTFGGGDGFVTTNVLGHDEATSAAITRDGRILVAGFTTVDNDGSSIALARYTADGAPDTTFGGDGTVTTSVNGNEHANTVALAPGGRFYVGGYTTSDAGGFDIALLAYLEDGTPDTSFDGDGVVTTPVTGDDREEITALVVQADVVTAAIDRESMGAQQALLLARFQWDGTADPSFDGDGWVTGTAGTGSGAVALVTAGTDLLVGTSDWKLVRYDRYGALRTGFGTGGVLTTDLPGEPDQLAALAWGRDGRLYAAGTAIPPGDTLTDFAATRYRIR
ncbi:MULTISPECIES: NHL repeat-containing protein [Catenuloplanes]|uniref:Delta-60 repeat protein n=1 Tax=Catenuloplanes niger TaxID=587534 RepID=A0AAE3ZWL1_9ACTN|nr:hypothetical protein [Catenuloplanes niger]MDR7327232.1 putative delta-60 repeat protein [Catenuloplanes niger]